LSLVVGDHLKFPQSRPLIFCLLLVALRQSLATRSGFSIALATRPLASLFNSNLRLMERLLSPDAAAKISFAIRDEAIGIGRSSHYLLEDCVLSARDFDW